MDDKWECSNAYRLIEMRRKKLVENRRTRWAADTFFPSGWDFFSGGIGHGCKFSYFYQQIRCACENHTISFGLLLLLLLNSPCILCVSTPTAPFAMIPWNVKSQYFGMISLQLLLLSKCKSRTKKKCTNECLMLKYTDFGANEFGRLHEVWSVSNFSYITQERNILDRSRALRAWAIEIFSGGFVSRNVPFF